MTYNKELLMMRKLAGYVACGAVLIGVGYAQFGRGGAEWSTPGGDPHRSSWIRSDAKINKDSVATGMAFLWKVKLNNAPLQLNSLSNMAITERYIGYRGFRSLSYIGGSSDTVFAFDTDLGRIEWQKRITPAAAAAGPSANCPGGMTANVTRPVTTAFPPMPGQGGPAMGGGRGGPAKSGVGEPLKGAVTLANQPEQRGFPPQQAANRKKGGAAPAGGPPRRQPNYVYALSSDGLFHSMYISNGDEPKPGVPFIPANANASGLTVIDGWAYVATMNGCGGAPDGVWAMEIESGKVTKWVSTSGSVVGEAGPAFGPDSTIYVATAKGDLVAIDSEKLTTKATYSSGSALVSSPVLFQMKDKSLLAVTAADGAIHIVDTASLSTPLSKTAAGAKGPLSSWQDPSGTRWLLSATANNITAWKVTESGSLERGWSSRELNAPATPSIVNGVIFALSTGFANRSGAVLYALDSATGKDVWNSGKTMTSFVHGGHISGGASQLYIGTNDGTVYAFGFPIEH